jgi:hypothetical protein
MECLWQAEMIYILVSQETLLYCIYLNFEWILLPSCPTAMGIVIQTLTKCSAMVVTLPLILSLDPFLKRDHFLKIGSSDLNSCPKCSILIRITSWSLQIWLQIYFVFFLGQPFIVNKIELSKGGFHIKWSQSKKPGLHSSCKNYCLILMYNMLYKPISEMIQLIVAADEVKGLKSMTFHDQPWWFWQGHVLPHLPNECDMMWQDFKKWSQNFSSLPCHCLSQILQSKKTEL